MTSLKRRKISTRKEEKGNSDTKVFREAFSLIFTGEHYRNAYSMFFFIPPSDISENEYMWENMTAENRVEYLKKYGEDGLDRLMAQLSHTTLKNFYNDNFPVGLRRTNLSKTTLTNEIKDRFFERPGALQRREMEAEIVSNMFDNFDEAQNYGFLTLCDIEIPTDILVAILSFLKYDKNMIFKIGHISKIFYITVLSSWPEIRIRKENVFRISVLVLRSVRSITFEVPQQTPSNTFLVSELDHIFSNVNPDRLREIHIESMIFSYVKFLRYFCHRKDSSVFRNVITLTFDIGDRINSALFASHSYVEDLSMVMRKKDFESYKPPWRGILLHKKFPNLECCGSPLNMNILESLKTLKGITVDLTVPYIYDKYVGCKLKQNTTSFYYRKSSKKPMVKFSEKITDLMGKLGTEKRDGKLHKKSISKLSIVFFGEDEENICQQIPLFLASQKFTNLRSLELDFRVMETSSDYCVQIHQFDLAHLAPLAHTLTELRLVDNFSSSFYETSTRGSKKSKNFMKSNGWKYPVKNRSEGFSNFLPNLRKLTVVSPAQTCIEDVVFCLSSVKVTELEVCMFLNYPSVDRAHHSLLMERISQRFFQFENIKMKIMWKLDDEFVATHSSREIFLELKYEKYIPYKTSILSPCKINMFSGRGELNKFSQDSRVRKVKNFPFLHMFVSEFPGILAKNRINAEFGDYTVSFFMEKNTTLQEDNEVDGTCISIFNQKIREEGRHSIKNQKFKEVVVEESNNGIGFIFHSYDSFGGKTEKWIQKPDDDHPHRVYVYSVIEGVHFLT